MAFWKESIDQIIHVQWLPLLRGKDEISHEQMEGSIMAGFRGYVCRDALLTQSSRR